MHKKIVSYSIGILIAAFSLLSCRTAKQLSYFQDLSDSSRISMISTVPYEPLKLQTNDEIQLTISSISPEGSQFFNLMAITPSTSVNGSPASQSQGYINIYRVSGNGFITMPVLGNIVAAGLTTEELQMSISEKLKDYLKDAVVTTKLINFKVTVIGEVGKPTVIPVNGQTFNVIEAVGAAGDMTVYGIRKNIKVIRKLPDGRTAVAVLDFNKSDVLRSPYFQLKQNDIVYVQPNKKKSFIASKASVWVPIVTGVLYVAAILLNRN